VPRSVKTGSCHSLKPSPDMNMTLKTLNRFMEQNEENEGFFLFVDSVDDRYEGPAERPARHGSSPDSPFVGKTPQECQALLEELQSNSQLDIGTKLFAILDDRSDREDSVLLVDDFNEDFETVKVAFELAMELLMCYVSGNHSIKEDIDSAQRADDGVLRDC
jgi:hypothetical protein